jgi:hypothetical protein
MSNKWICKETCYVHVGDKLKLRHPGEPATGKIEESAQKYFDRVSLPKTATSDTQKEPSKPIKKRKGKKGSRKGC